MTANMTNRDAKGKFVKTPATQTFKPGDTVDWPAGGQSHTGGTVREIYPCSGHVEVWWPKTGGTWASYLPSELQPAPAPCPFKVGDRVERVISETDNVKIGSLGTVNRVDAKWAYVYWDKTKQGDSYPLDTDHLRKMEDAPAKPCRVDVDLLIYERDGLLDEVSRLKTEAKERANAYSQNMQAVKDELAEAQRQATWWESVNKSTAFREKAEQRERGKAEAKLADIAAINRVAEIVNALPEGSEDWHFQGLVADVLKGTVAA